MTAASTAPPRRSRCLAALLLAFGLWLHVVPELHAGALHGSEERASWRVDGGCSKIHPPSFEALRGERFQGCPGCLVEAHTLAAPSRGLPVLGSDRDGRSVPAPIAAAPAIECGRSVAPRGPPAA